MGEEPTCYIVVTSPKNWAKTAERGWTLLGLKSTKPGQAGKFRSGDKVVAYATGIKKLIGALEVTSEMFVDHTPIWASAKMPGEDYPNRVETRPLVTLGESEYLDAFELGRRLEYAKKWGDHISLAFQGNIRPIPQADYDLILAEIEAAKRRERHAV
jgi:predicted RNA-binding protein